MHVKSGENCSVGFREEGVCVCGGGGGGGGGGWQILHAVGTNIACIVIIHTGYRTF